MALCFNGREVASASGAKRQILSLAQAGRVVEQRLWLAYPETYAHLSVAYAQRPATRGQ